MAPVNDDQPSPLDSNLDLRRAAVVLEQARRRSERRTRLLSNAFLAIAALTFTIGLAVLAAAYGRRAGLDLPLEDLGVFGQAAASIAGAGAGSSEQASGSGSRAAPVLPTALPSATPTQTATPTETPLPSATPTASSTPTASLTPSETPLPSATPLPSPTLNETQRAAITDTPKPSPAPSGFPGCDPSGKSAFESALVDLINQERQDNDLPAYTSSARLRDAARAHSTDMACNGFFSHTGSDGSSVGDRVFLQNYPWHAVGENIFGTGDTSDEAPQLAFDFWVAGAANQANMLSEEYREIGVGYVRVPDSPFGGYFTAVFAQP